MHIVYVLCVSIIDNLKPKRLFITSNHVVHLKRKTKEKKKKSSRYYITYPLKQGVFSYILFQAWNHHNRFEMILKLHKNTFKLLYYFIKFLCLELLLFERQVIEKSKDIIGLLFDSGDEWWLFIFQNIFEALNLIWIPFHQQDTNECS